MSDFCQIPRKNCNVVLKFVCKNPIQTIKTKKKKKKIRETTKKSSYKYSYPRVSCYKKLRQFILPYFIKPFSI